MIYIRQTTDWKFGDLPSGGPRCFARPWCARRLGIAGCVGSAAFVQFLGAARGSSSVAALFSVLYFVLTIAWSHGLDRRSTSGPRSSC